MLPRDPSDFVRWLFLLSALTIVGGLVLAFVRLLWGLPPP